MGANAHYLKPNLNPGLVKGGADRRGAVQGGPWAHRPKLKVVTSPALAWRSKYNGVSSSLLLHMHRRLHRPHFPIETKRNHEPSCIRDQHASKQLSQEQNRDEQSENSWIQNQIQESHHTLSLRVCTNFKCASTKWSKPWQESSIGMIK